ncbi:MAG: ABC transporter permease subunit, partial [Gammaproteobacteria bacterium]|nr:ABC transporter permease subunit [Gammaproteobacteria bacterium]
PVTNISPEFFRKGFISINEKGELAVNHLTAHSTLLQQNIESGKVNQLAISPRADHFLAESDAGVLHFWHITNEYPEISVASLWDKVWYEGYSEPDYIWQSSSASNEFEPKFSLVPLSFGTLKAAFYAMLIAMPLAILGAVYTAYFMSPKLRQTVKPTIEIMEALPTVILGFLAGLWFAPFLETHMPGVFSVAILLPIAILVFAYIWFKLPHSLVGWIPDGWQPVLLLPVIILFVWGAIEVSPLMESAFFGGNLPIWLNEELGIGYDQRNAMVVGFAMGFAIIPTIFSIAEDAIFSVPKHLTTGSLALGATPWQTLTRVVILTASPGIFSAVMIGFGRAVGETMIVLMATGNTPVLDFSFFEGMRTFSANIAVEMPESEVGSTHYRVLFLAALILFMFTFMFNTIAEVVRQHLRSKYSSL